jgi:hypothetical protein
MFDIQLVFKRSGHFWKVSHLALTRQATDSVFTRYATFAQLLPPICSHSPSIDSVAVEKLNNTKHG